jgi:hypothetical protein
MSKEESGEGEKNNCPDSILKDTLPSRAFANCGATPQLPSHLITNCRLPDVRLEHIPNEFPFARAILFDHLYSVAVAFREETMNAPDIGRLGFRALELYLTGSTKNEDARMRVINCELRSAADIPTVSVRRRESTCNENLHEVSFAMSGGCSASPPRQPPMKSARHIRLVFRQGVFTECAFNIENDSEAKSAWLPCCN